jgi:OOP family OmpA-OmpF porin
MFLVGLFLACAGMAGCGLCTPVPKETGEVPVVERPVEEPPPAPAPVVEPPPVVAPVEPPPVVPPAVVKAIQDLGDKYPGLFTFDPEKGMFHFQSDITFDSGSSVVKSGAKAALTKLAEILSGDEAKDRALTIIGHTDSDRVGKASTIAHLRGLGKSPDNMGLSEARAEAVAAVLQAGGIDAARMTTQGKGQTEPVADNHTPAGKAQNRRVDIFLTPMTNPGT